MIQLNDAVDHFQRGLRRSWWSYGVVHGFISIKKLSLNIRSGLKFLTDAVLLKATSYLCRSAQHRKPTAKNENIALYIACFVLLNPPSYLPALSASVIGIGMP